MSITPPDGRCGYTTDYPDPGEITDEVPGNVACWRETVEGEERCFWHSEELDEKPPEKLKQHRVMETKIEWHPEHQPDELGGPLAERLDGARLRGCDLRDVPFRHCTLAGADLRDANCKEGDFAGANFYKGMLRNANFFKADLRGGYLSRADLSSISFQATDLRGGADLGDCDLTEGLLRAAKLQEANLMRADLTRANLRSANLKGAFLQGATLTDAVLEGVNAQGIVMESANLTRTQLAGADLSGAYLYGSTLTDVQITNSTDISEAYTTPLKNDQKDILTTLLTAYTHRWVTGVVAEAHTSATLLTYWLAGEFGDQNDLDIDPEADTDLSVTVAIPDYDLAERIGMDLHRVRRQLESLNVLNLVKFQRDSLSGDLGYVPTAAAYTILDRQPAQPSLPTLDDAPQRIDKGIWMQRQLEINYRTSGLSRQARRAFIRRKDLRREQYWRQTGIPELWSSSSTPGSRPSETPESTVLGRLTRTATDIFQWGRAASSGVLMRYGESPTRIVMVSLGVVIGSAFLYPFDGFGPASDQPLQYPHTFDIAGTIEIFLKSVYFSTVTFTTVGYGDFQPLNWGRGLAAVESFVGALLMALLVFVLGRRATW